MKRVLTSCIYLLGVLIVINSTVRAIQADPVVMLIPLSDTPGIPMRMFVPADLNRNNSSVTFAFANDTGDFVINFMNNTGVRLDGLDIRVTPQPQNITGTDSTGFITTALVIFGGTSNSQIVFTVTIGNFPGGGIPPGAKFALKFSGFTGRTDTTVIPTGVPEPATVFLLATGLAGIVIKMRKTLSRSNSEPSSQ